MAFDAGFTCAVASELSDRLTGGRIEKIFQPTRDSVLFYVHPERAATLKLIIDVNPSNCRMGITR
ncbi:MAG: NFACT family protein, partial [Clostridia bacterium]|nr:NFACT family protein [Clostridia bacterium]